MKPALLIALVVASCVAAAELALRATGYEATAWHQPDPRLGWSLRPGISGWYTDEGGSFVRINSAGQRDRERSLDKPEGVYRIAVLGDAYSEAMHVPLEQAYWALLGERLERCGFAGGRRIEVLNFGVRGYGTAQAYVMLETAALRYRPDLVLLQFTNGSDVRDNSLALDPRRVRPYLIAGTDGPPQLDYSFNALPAYLRRTSPAYALYRRLADRSRLLQYAREAGTGLQMIGQARASSPPNEVGLEPEVLAAPRDRAWKEAWRITELLLEGMRDLAQSHGAAMAVFTVPYAVAVHPEAKLRASVQSKYGVPELAYPDRRIASFAHEHGIIGITLYEEMQALADRTGRALYGFDNLLPGFSHWNGLGHDAAAEIIARKLCASPS